MLKWIKHWGSRIRHQAMPSTSIHQETMWDSTIERMATRIMTTEVWQDYMAMGGSWGTTGGDGGTNIFWRYHCSSERVRVSSMQIGHENNWPEHLWSTLECRPRPWKYKREEILCSTCDPNTYRWLLSQSLGMPRLGYQRRESSWARGIGRKR